VTKEQINSLAHFPQEIDLKTGGALKLDFWLEAS